MIVELNPLHSSSSLLSTADVQQAGGFTTGARPHNDGNALCKHAYSASPLVEEVRSGGGQVILF